MRKVADRGVIRRNGRVSCRSGDRHSYIGVLGKQKLSVKCYTLLEAGRRLTPFSAVPNAAMLAPNTFIYPPCKTVIATESVRSPRKRRQSS